MAETNPRVCGRRSRLFVDASVESTQALPPILELYNKIVALKAKPAPVLNDAQAFPGSIEIGIDQSCNSPIDRWPLIHRFHGTLSTILSINMENGGSDSSMKVLIWGIVLLGSIGVFIVWGLVNAYPGMA